MVHGACVSCDYGIDMGISHRKQMPTSMIVSMSVDTMMGIIVHMVMNMDMAVFMTMLLWPCSSPCFPHGERVGGVPMGVPWGIPVFSRLLVSFLTTLVCRGPDAHFPTQCKLQAMSCSSGTMCSKHVQRSRCSVAFRVDRGCMACSVAVPLSA